MSIEKRIEALEKALPGGDIVLYTANGIRIDGTVSRKPTPDRPGEALVADGSTRSIAYDATWREQKIIITDDTYTDEGGALYMRLSDAVVRIITSIPRPEENAGS